MILPRAGLAAAAGRNFRFLPRRGFTTRKTIECLSAPGALRTAGRCCTKTGARRLGLLEMRLTA